MGCVEKRLLIAVIILSVFSTVGCVGVRTSSDVTAEQNRLVDALVNTYGDIAYSAYSESLQTARHLQAAIAQFLIDPTEQALQQAKNAYKQSRKPFAQTALFHFRFPSEASDYEGLFPVAAWRERVSGWPINTSLMDYLHETLHANTPDLFRGNGQNSGANDLINSGVLRIAAQEISVDRLSQPVILTIDRLARKAGSGVTGYHAIEFLLWGQDLNGPSAGSGERPLSDYFQSPLQGDCTSGPLIHYRYTRCKKRARLLALLTQQLVDDLTLMQQQWRPNANGTLRTTWSSRPRLEALKLIQQQVIDWSLTALLETRLNTLLRLGSVEQEHDAFSDLTHWTYAYQAKSIYNLYNGTYVTAAGEHAVAGVGWHALLTVQQSKALKQRFILLNQAFHRIVLSAEQDDLKFDQLIATPEQAMAAYKPVSAATQAHRRAVVQEATEALTLLGLSLQDAAQRTLITVSGGLE